MIDSSFSGGIATFTLSRPPVNAISEEWLRLFEAKLDELAQHDGCSVLHIRSDQKVFSAGADLKEMRARMAERDGPDRMYSFVAGIQRLYSRIEALPQVTVAEIGGSAMGGGLELALACDLRLAAAEAKLGLPEARLGLIPGAGGTQRLTRLCGRPTAARLILTAETVDGISACALGMVQWAFPRAALPERALEIVRSAAELPGAALAAAKKCIAAACEAERGGYSDELEATRALFGDAETRARVEAFLASTAKAPDKLRAGAGR